MAPVRSVRARFTVRLGLVLAVALLANACDNENEPSGTNTEVSFCPDDAPIWFAVQDGDGLWTRLAPVSEGVYEVTLATGRGGIAYAGQDGYGVVVNYGAGAEFGSIQCHRGSRQVDGNVQDASSAIAWLGYAEGYTDEDLRLSIHGVADGPQDLFAGRLRSTPAGNSDRYIIRRNQDVPSGGQLALLDFGSAEAFAPAVVNLTITGTNSDETYLSTRFRGNQGSLDATLSSIYGVAGGPVPVHLVPAEQLQPGELNSVEFMFYQGETARQVITFVTEPADMALTPGPLLATPEITRQTLAGALLPGALLPAQDQYSRMATARFLQAVEVVVTVTASYLESSPSTWELRMPDLTYVDGWSESWNLDPRHGFDWAVSAAGGVNLTLDEDGVQAGNQFYRAETYGYHFPPAMRALRQGGRTSPRSWGFPPIPTRPAH